ncbi:telomerase reverse transcriptase-like [Pimephales promelas]|uniref:telomerase reverse transcriptase-like n=1 Tax=Pimephales promelas TaxID=90988 RepID=UPI001955632B|nr:telomerase reverse transcriptase-like [Pimephales promelas]KAG1929038.1 telomerase reverse transcriptase [Pimephales promelas]
MSRRDATDGGFKYVFGILRSLYPVVQTLEEFADGLVFSDGRKPALLEERDGARFKNLVRGLMICAFTPPQQQRVPAQLSTLPEVLAFTLNHIKRKKLRNVLGFGYQCNDVSACSDPFRFHGDVSQTAAYISTSELWKRINQRLGTEVTRHLLQDCAVFATVPPTCLLQVCGEPVYDRLIPSAWSGFSLSHVSAQTQKNSGIPWKTITRDATTRTRDAKISARDAKTFTRDAKTFARHIKMSKRDVKMIARGAKTIARDAKTSVTDANTVTTDAKMLTVSKKRARDDEKHDKHPVMKKRKVITDESDGPPTAKSRISELEARGATPSPTVTLRDTRPKHAL